MDTGSASISGEENPDYYHQIDMSTGRTIVAVQGTETSAAETTDGWQVAGRRLRQRNTPASNGEPNIINKEPIANRTMFARKVTAKITRESGLNATPPHATCASETRTMK